MATTATKLSGARTYRVPMPSSEDFPAFHAGMFTDEVVESMINDNDPDHSFRPYIDLDVGVALRSLAVTDDLGRGLHSMLEASVLGHHDATWPSTFVRGQNAVHLASQPSWIEIAPAGMPFSAGSFAMGTHIQSVDHFAKVNDIAMMEPLVAGTWRGNFNRHLLDCWIPLETGPGSGRGTSVSGEVIHPGMRQLVEAHRRLITRPDLTARIALRLADIPEISRAEDSILPSQDVVNATMRVVGYLPATTAVPQIEIDDSMGSISLVWRDKLNENVFSLEIPNSRFAVGVGFGEKFSKFKAWRHPVSDERKIVGEIEASEATRKLLSGA